MHYYEYFKRTALTIVEQSLNCTFGLVLICNKILKLRHLCVLGKNFQAFIKGGVTNNINLDLV